MQPKKQWQLEVEYRSQIESGEITPLEDFGAYVAASFPGAPLVASPQRDPVMHRAMMMIQNGLLPTQEMLLVMADCYQEYLDAAGSKSLEAAMLGPPKPRVGTMSAQKAKRDIRTEMTFAVEFLSAKKDGVSDADAAAMAQAETERIVGRAPDAENWLRDRRRKRADK